MNAPLSLLFPPTLGKLRAHARAEILSESLGRRLARAVEVEVAGSYGELESQVLGGAIDLAWAPPSICARAEPSAAAIFKAVRFGESTYNAALVGRASDTPALDGLAGLRASWVDQLSAAGYLLPFAHLSGLGLDPAALFASQEFCGSYQGALLAVLSGRADVTAIYCHGTTDAAARRTLRENVGASEIHLAPFAYTEAAPSDGLIATARVGDDVIDAVERAVDGSLGPTLLLELFEADRLERAASDEYAALRIALDTASR